VLPYGQLPCTIVYHRLAPAVNHLLSYGQIPVLKFIIKKRNKTGFNGAFIIDGEKQKE
jgi:hypothetical protein